jgi:ABC-type methionine transport system ATPase subunit
MKIIDDFSFAFERGRIYTIVGPSGSGKTSLLRLFNRLDEKSSGDIFYLDRPIEEVPVAELRSNIALTFQIPYLFPGTVASNLKYGLKDKSTINSDFCDRFLTLVGLDPGIAERNPEKLSVGQQQRVALARLLVLKPHILLLDEPTSALDPGAAGIIEELIVQLNQELYLTIIMVTHNFRQALRLDGISLFLADGRMIESGVSETLFANPAREITRKFINGELR